MTGLPCNDEPPRGSAILRSAAFAALVLLAGANNVWALSPPTELTPPEPPAGNAPLPPPGGSGSGIDTEQIGRAHV